MTDHPLTYSTAEAAAMIPCREPWLVDKLRAGQFRARKIHRQWRLTMADIENVIAECEVTVEARKDPRASMASFRRKQANKTGERS